jgi:hypothetical protein
MIAGCLDGMTRSEAWRNADAIRRLAAIEREHHQGTERESNHSSSHVDCERSCEHDDSDFEHSSHKKRPE